MKILLTGATGFLGSHLVKTLLKEGHQIIIFKRSFSDPRRIADILPQISAYDLDVCGIEKPFSEHDKIDAVIHTATCYGKRNETAGAVMEANTVFPLKLLETAASAGTPHFINTDTVLDRYVALYAMSKKHFSEWGKLFAETGKIRFVNVRMENFYGPGDDESKFITRIIKDCLKNVPEIKLTPGEQKRDFIHIDDAVSAYPVILRGLPECGDPYSEFDVGSGKSVSIREFAQTVRDLAGSTTRLNFGALPRRRHEPMESRADTSPLAALGWSCRTGFLEGLKATIAAERKKCGY